MKLRPKQQALVDKTYAAWDAGANAVMMVSPCGSGKTVMFSHIMSREKSPSLLMAHRSELVAQAAMALARFGVYHRVIGQAPLIRQVVKSQMDELGQSFYNASANTIVASVQTLVNIKDETWCKQIKLIVGDEGHHFLRDNQFGRAVALFPNARLLLPTASPIRTDGKGLGRHADGFVDAMVQGVTMRELIEDEHLSEYKIYCPKSDIDFRALPISKSSGDYCPAPLSKAMRDSKTITGGVVDSYLKYAKGLRGITFAVDVDSAERFAEAYRFAGVSAEVMHGGTAPEKRYQLKKQMERGELLQLCCCDLISEGFDLPAVEVCSLARPSESVGLYLQQVCRGSRPYEGKSYWIIIDHVGNIKHGLPDFLINHRTGEPLIWSLDRRENVGKSTSEKIESLRVCIECIQPYSPIEHGRTCPFCGTVSEPAGRSTPEEVGGDLFELSQEALARMRGEIDKPPTYPYGADVQVIGAINKHHRLKSEAQVELREKMAIWASGKTDIRRAQREFYHKFKIDVMSAQALNAKDAIELAGRLG